MLLELLYLGIVEFLLCGQSVLLADLELTLLKLFREVGHSLFLFLLRGPFFIKAFLELLKLGIEQFLLRGQSILPAKLQTVGLRLLCVLAYDFCFRSLVCLGQCHFVLAIFPGYLKGGFVEGLQGRELQLVVKLLFVPVAHACLPHLAECVIVLLAGSQ